MFNLINVSSPGGHYYGHVDVKLAICRFVSEFLLRLPKGVDNYLDETVSSFNPSSINHTSSD